MKYEPNSFMFGYLSKTRFSATSFMLTSALILVTPRCFGLRPPRGRCLRHSPRTYSRANHDDSLFCLVSESVCTSYTARMIQFYYCSLFSPSYNTITYLWCVFSPEFYPLFVLTVHVCGAICLLNILYGSSCIRGHLYTH